MKLTKFFASILAGGLMSLSVMAEGQFVQGKDYEVTAPATKTEPVVEEFFNYACGGCFSAERFANEFKQKNPNIQFKYVPVELRPAWKIYVEAFFIGQKLGVLEQSHPKIFDRLHVKKKFFKGHDDMKAFFLELGVDEKEYDKTVKSYWLKVQLKKAKQYAFKHKVTGTPMYVVNKRFKLNKDTLSTYDRIESAMVELSKKQ